MIAFGLWFAVGALLATVTDAIRLLINEQNIGIRITAAALGLMFATAAYSVWSVVP